MSQSPQRREESRHSPERRDDRDDRRRSRSRSRDRDSKPGGGGGGPGRMKGTAMRWNERGFGFIKPMDGSEDVFCHFSAIQDGNCLQDGDEVEFSSVYDDRKGKYRAEEVTGGRTEDRRGPGGGGGAGGGGRSDECFDFKQGRCTRGDSCRFSHGGGGGGGGYGGGGYGGGSYGGNYNQGGGSRPPPARDAW